MGLSFVILPTESMLMPLLMLKMQRKLEKKIVSGMVGKNVDEISFRRKYQAVTFASKSSVKSGSF